MIWTCPMFFLCQDWGYVFSSYITSGFTRQLHDITGDVPLRRLVKAMFPRFLHYHVTNVPLPLILLLGSKSLSLVHPQGRVRGRKPALLPGVREDLHSVFCKEDFGPKAFNITGHQKSTGIVSDSTLQLIFKKLPLVEFWHSIKEQPQLFKKAIKIPTFSKYISV